VSTPVADYVLNRLSEWGIHRIYGYPGDGINGFLGAFDRVAPDPEFTQVRHEEMAAFMACAHAKFTGEIGCCVATSGPGAIHLLNGLYDAKLDHQPVLAIVGQQKRTSIGAHYQQEVDLQTLFTDVSAFCNTCNHPAQARHLIDRAIRTALAERSVATIIVPEDVQEEDAVPSPPREHGSVFSSVGYSEPRVIPRQADLDRAAEILNGSEKVAILIGQGAAKAADEVVEVAELLGAGVAKALLGRAALPDDLPFVTGPIGLLGSKATNDMMTSCDCLLMVGTSFPYAEWLPEEGQARCVEVDIDARMIGIRYPADVPLVGDSKETLAALIPLLDRKADRSWREQIEQNVKTWWRVVDDRAHEETSPMNPRRVLWELSSALPDDAVVVADSGSSTNWWARDLRLRKGMMASLSGTLATMGPAVPYAIAAKFAYPERAVVAVLGDGAFQMGGMAELLTVKRFWESHLRPGAAPLVFCVFNNQDLNQVTWEQRVLSGDPRNPATQQIPDFPYAKYGELVGFKGLRCEDGEQIAGMWKEALSTTDTPVLCEVVTDRETPPLPPHINLEQARKMAGAVAKGDEDRVGIMRKSLKGKLEELKETVRS
jgi:pyruvate dehydrogenase (quinone)